MVQKRRVQSDWILFVKAFAAKNGLTYKEALSVAGPYYRNAKGGMMARRKYNPRRY